MKRLFVNNHPPIILAFKMFLTDYVNLVVNVEPNLHFNDVLFIFISSVISRGNFALQGFLKFLGM